jgi:amino acid adenylation domain-containing protein
MEAPNGAGSPLEVIRHWARTTPDEPAVETGTYSLTYRELVTWCDRVRSLVEAAGATPGTIVALYLPRGPQAIAGMLGVLAAGCAFLPLEHGAPPARTQDLVRRARPVLCISSSGRELALSSPREVRFPTCESPRGGDAGTCMPMQTDLAYVMYTSGSSGQPKGVMVERRSLANLLQAHRSLGVRSTDRYLVFAPPHFDGFLVDSLVPLMHGACAVTLPSNELMPGPDLADTMERLGVTAATLPPAALAVMPARRINGLRMIVTAGEAIPEPLARFWVSNVEFVYSSYGPTEATVAATLGRLAPGFDRVHVGSPLSGISVHLLQSDGSPCERGSVGEFFIGGAGVARGYLHDPQLTAARFIPDHLSSTPGGRLYRTGDLGLQLQDGRFVFVGRSDRELKVRGVRIQPAEVERAMESVPGVRASVVTAIGLGAERRLVALFVPTNGVAASEAAEDSVRRAVADLLPPALRPQAFRAVDVLPMTASGKVDHGSVSAAFAATAPTTYPREVSARPIPQDIAAHVARMWSTALATPVAADEQRSFYNLGGHSLLAVQLLGEVERRFGIRISYAEFFANPTLQYIAERTLESHSHEA